MRIDGCGNGTLLGHPLGDERHGVHAGSSRSSEISGERGNGMSEEMLGCQY